MKRILQEVNRYIEMFLSLIPGVLGYKLRTIHYKTLIKKCGKNFKIGIFSRIQQPQALSIGHNVSFNDFAWIAANSNGGEIKIGDNTIIGPRVILHSGNHVFTDRIIPIWKQGYKFKPIIIEEDVWLGSNVTVLQGVTIHRGAVVAAGSIITKDVDEYTIVGGVPAKTISKR